MEGQLPETALQENTSPDAVLKANRAARKQAKREKKAEKMPARIAAKTQNALRYAVSMDVRFSEVAAATASSAAEAGGSEATNTRHDTDGEQSGGAAVVSLFGLDLREFSLALLPQSWASILSLDLSHNELSELPGIERLVSLSELNLCRNHFRVLPSSLRLLSNLSKLNASRNDIRPSLEFMQILLRPPVLQSLQELDITFNKLCYTQELEDFLTAKLPNVAVRMTVTFPPPPGAKVGESAGDRDSTLLRSQLEPYTTLQLRRRLVETFGEEPYAKVGPKPPPRAELMEHLLERYVMAGVVQERKLVRVNGTPVDPELLEELLVLMREWAARHTNHQERPNIHAQTYMILRSPVEFEEKLPAGSRKAHAAKTKYEQNERLWKLAVAAMASVDPDFAATFTGLALTQGFRGSPHIDTTNSGPFYGLSFGDFADGTGGIRVELDAMTVAEVNTKGRLGKVDGRFPHWVAPYDEGCERFSLIYYKTDCDVVPQTSAVFGSIIEE